MAALDVGWHCPAQPRRQTGWEGQKFKLRYVPAESKPALDTQTHWDSRVLLHAIGTHSCFMWLKKRNYLTLCSAHTGNLRACFVSSIPFCLPYSIVPRSESVGTVHILCLSIQHSAPSTQHSAPSTAAYLPAPVWQSLKKVTVNCTLTLARTSRLLQRADYSSYVLQGLSGSHPGAPQCYCTDQHYPVVLKDLPLRRSFLRFQEVMRPVDKAQALEM